VPLQGGNLPGSVRDVAKEGVKSNQHAILDYQRVTREKAVHRGGKASLTMRRKNIVKLSAEKGGSPTQLNKKGD